MNTNAFITEIFSSLQGEGPHTGEPMTFVRFAGCSVACRWCDTRSLGESEFYKIETPPNSRHFINTTNPVTIEKLNEHLSFFTDPTIAVTGGEPLEQAEFIANWLPSLKPARKILLETNGTLPQNLESVAKHVDIISMDIKLPSSTGRPAFWQEHALFLSKARETGKETYVKIVVTEDTTDKDIQEAIQLIAAVNKFTPVVLQPAAETVSFSKKTSLEHIRSLERLCQLWLPNTSVMPQMHKKWDVL